MFHELSEVVGSELRKDGDQRKKPKEYPQQQELESIEIIFAHTATNQFEVHDLILYAYSTIMTMKSCSCLNNISFVFITMWAQFSIIVFLNDNAWVDEGGGNPGHIEIDEDEDGQVIESECDFIFRKVDNDEDGDGVDDNEHDNEVQICLR